MITDSIVKLIDQADLKQLKHRIMFKNDTSGTESINDKRNTLVELQEKGIILRVPKLSCAQGHNISIFLVPLPLKTRISKIRDINKIEESLEIIGKVTKLTPVEDDKSELVTITVTFTQYDKKEWYYLVKQYIDKQIAINNLKPKF